MNRRTIGLDELADEIRKVAVEVGQDVANRTEKIIESAADHAVAEIQATAPRSTSATPQHFADSFTKEKILEGLNAHFKVFSATQWQITHILEFGFVHYGKGSKYIKGRQFMLPAYEKAQAEIVRNIREELSKK